MLVEPGRTELFLDCSASVRSSSFRLLKSLGMGLRMVIVVPPALCPLGCTHVYKFRVLEGRKLEHLLIGVVSQPMNLQIVKCDKNAFVDRCLEQIS